MAKAHKAWSAKGFGCGSFTGKPWSYISDRIPLCTPMLSTTSMRIKYILHETWRGVTCLRCLAKRGKR